VGRSRLQVAIDWASESSEPPPKRLFAEWIRAALPSDAHGEIAVRIVDEVESATLNERYRGRKGATNVLAFESDPAVAGLDPLPPIGDLVICAAVVEREARDQNKPIGAHWAHIVVHGALHLIGYDHDSDRAAHEMENKEREVLARLGYPDPYETHPRPH
jgi:probable rRNA maturation factor